MQSCTETSGEAGGKHRRVDQQPKAALVEVRRCSSVPVLHSVSSSLAAPAGKSLDTTPQAAANQCATATGKNTSLLKSSKGGCACDSAAGSTAGTKIIPPGGIVDGCDNQEISSHEKHDSIQSSPTDASSGGFGSSGTAGSPHSASMSTKDDQYSGALHPKSHASGVGECTNKEEVAGVSTEPQVDGETNRDGSLFFCTTKKYADKVDTTGEEVAGVSTEPQMDGETTRDGSLFFCTTKKYADKVDTSSERSESGGDGDREESLLPRNFFPFNNFFAAAGWGSAGAWFFSSSGLFPAADVSSDASAETTDNDADEQDPAEVYLPPLSGVLQLPKGLPALLSFEKAAAAQNDMTSEQKSVQRSKAALRRPAVEGTVLLASPWQERLRHDPARMKLRCSGVDVFAGASSSTCSVGLRGRETFTRPEQNAETRAGNSSRISSIFLLTKSVSNVFYGCLCRVLRNRFSPMTPTAAAAAAATKAVKKIRRAPGILRALRQIAIGPALQDFSLTEAVRQWYSSLLIMGQQKGESPVFSGPAGVKRYRRAAVPESDGNFVEGQNGGPAGSTLSATAAACAASAHVFITPEAGRLLWRSACSLIVNPATAMYFQCYRLASLGTIVYVTSVVHWWKPQLGIRRTVDVLAVCIVSGIHVIVAFVHAEPPVLLLYLLLCCGGVMCYFLGCSLALQGLHVEAAVCHVGLHSLCTLANLLLYYTMAA